MSEFSSLTHKFRANIDGNHAGGANKVTKRNRQPLSCAPCRFKKLKCDRGHPCETCVKRGDAVNCTYGKVPIPKPFEPTSDASVPSNRGRAQERLRHLEQLVMQMVDTSNGVKSPPESSREGTDSSIEKPGIGTATSIAKEGHLQYGSSEARYVGSTHWSAIMENIQELKSALSSNTDGGDQPFSTDLDETEDMEPQEEDNMFGTTSNVTLAQVLHQYLPPRPQVDRRLKTFFRSDYLVVPFIHTAQFQRQYEQFWRTPLETPVLWVSILFSLCSLSAGLSEAVGSEPSTPEDQVSPRLSLRFAACQCLRLGGFTRPKRHVVEALSLYAQCKYVSALDPSREVGIIFSIVVRLAYRSGYHRDPSQFPHISVFEGEMRRRAWAMCRQFDLMVSFQLGLPSQIPPDSWDTKNPRNLSDVDLSEDMTVLPPSNPETEATQILYFVVKSRLMSSFGKVCAHALTFCNDDCTQQIMDLDREVRATYATVPKVLHIKPMSQSFADPSYLTMVRTNCEFLYQKSLLVLHRKYMTQGLHTASARACTDAALAIARHMLDLHQEFKPGGQLFQDRWMLTSFTMNDFYLAIMVLGVGLSMWRKASPGQSVDADEKMKEQFAILKDSLGVCTDLTPTSNEAKKVANVLRRILGEKGDGASAAPYSSYTSTGEGQSNPFLQPGRTMNSAMFPMHYDFNLAPLTLQDEDRVLNDIGSTSSNTTASQPPQQPQRQPGSQAGSDSIGTYPPEVLPCVNSLGGFPRLVRGLNNPSPLGSSSFTSYIPFSAAANGITATPGSHAPPSQIGTRTTGDLDAQTQPQPQSLGSDSISTGMDVDWPLFDQWVALSNSTDIIPYSDDSFQNFTSEDREQSSSGGGDGGDGNGSAGLYPPLDEAQATAPEDPGMSWESSPWFFHGHGNSEWRFGGFVPG